MIQLSFLVLYNLLRFFILKLFNWGRIKVHLVQRISPFCALKVYDRGRLSIGYNCQFESGCDLQIHKNARLVLGRRVYMNRYCMVSAQGSVEIGDNTIFGPGVKVFDNNHVFSKEKGVSQELSIGSIKIGNNCWIASNVVILKGTEVGDNCIIGAGCIIKGIIPAGSIVKPSINNIIENIQK